MARVLAVVCLSAFVAACFSSAIPAGNPTRGLTDISQCNPSNLLILDAANCLDISHNIVTAGIIGGGVTTGCNQKCTNGTSCYEFNFLRKSDNKPVLSLRGGGGGNQFKCCTADGNGNIVNCENQECTATSTTAANADAKCCTVCDKTQAIAGII